LWRKKFGSKASIEIERLIYEKAKTRMRNKPVKEYSKPLTKWSHAYFVADFPYRNRKSLNCCQIPQGWGRKIVSSPFLFTSKKCLMENMPTIKNKLPTR
jgi:endonuclease YncB( thermonuclease family)